MKNLFTISVYGRTYSEKWIKQINESVQKDVVKILVANKIDVNPEEWEIQNSDGKALADKFGMEFMEVSALTGKNVNELFQKIGQ